MAWELKRGRGMFLNDYHFRADRSFWWHLGTLMGEAAAPEQRATFMDFLEDPERRRFLEWSPTNSNCPAIAAIVDDVADSVPPKWRALCRNIFVGIAPVGAVDALAWNHRDSGIVEISLQYLWVLEAYASAFDEFRHAMTMRVGDLAGARLNRHPDPAYGDMRASWLRLDEAVKVWRDGRVIYPGAEGLVRLAPGREQAEIDRCVSGAEKFIVCHELAHHILAHTSRNANHRAKEAQRALEPVIVGLPEELIPLLNQSWRREIEADLLALAIMCRKLDGSAPGSEPGSYSDAYTALIGTILALTAATHENEHWVVSRAGDTHPPLTTRLRFVFAAVRVWYLESPRGDYNDHPLEFCSQLRAFVDAAVSQWLGRDLLPEAAEEESISSTDSVDKFLEMHVQRHFQLREEVPLRADAKTLDPPEGRVTFRSHRSNIDST